MQEREERLHRLGLDAIPGDDLQLGCARPLCVPEKPGMFETLRNGAERTRVHSAPPTREGRKTDEKASDVAGGNDGCDFGCGERRGLGRDYPMPGERFLYCQGTEQSDVINGTDVRDYIGGEGGDDTVNGGDDLIFWVKSATTVSPGDPATTPSMHTRVGVRHRLRQRRRGR